MASGQGRYCLIETPAVFHLYVTRPSEIFANFVFKHIHAASIYTICRWLVPFICCPLWVRVLSDVVICEHEYFLMLSSVSTSTFWCCHLWARVLSDVVICEHEYFLMLSSVSTSTFWCCPLWARVLSVEWFSTTGLRRKSVTSLLPCIWRSFDHCNIISRGWNKW